MRMSPTNLCVFFQIHANLLLLMLFSSFSSNVNVNRNGTDQLTLLQFKAKITTDPLGVLNSWNDTINLCHWHGVTCGRRHLRVTKLVINSSQLSGSISPHIGNLSFLRLLNLNNNSFSDEIPSEIGQLRRLEKLHLRNNSFSGEIPWNISSCTNLVDIDIYNNHLVGEIPESLGSLLKLRYIILAKNNLTGSIPSSFGNLSSLEKLYVSDNNLGGIIPDSLGQLKNFSIIAIASNRLNGTIPPSIFNISSMMVIDVGVNLFHGNLPSHLGLSLPNLLFFSIYQNQFTGSIQFSFSNASQLKTLELSHNQLTGRGPFVSKLSRLQWLTLSDNYLGRGRGDDLSFLSSLVNATRPTTLQILNIDHNSFGGMLPQEICNLTELIYLLLNDNQIHGSVPHGIVNLVTLQLFSASGNHLSGIIPPNIGLLQNLVILSLFNNIFTGYIPSSFGNLTNLNILYLYENNLQGSIPSNLSKSLSIFALDNNNFSGIIPQTIGLSSLLINLGLSRNHLIGSLPTEVEKLTHLGGLYLSENMLSGEIPSSLSSCTSLEVLYMEGNLFHGPIPLTLSSLRGLQELDLSRNNLSGKIPEFLGGFALSYLNLSLNDFDGEVPKNGVFKNANATTVFGNNKLCGGILEFHLPACNLENSNKRRLKNRLKTIVATFSVLSGVTLVLSFIYLLWFGKRRKRSASSTYGSLLWRVSYKSLLNATGGFSSSNLIGVGSFGTVYKGILDEEGTIIVVKVLNLLHRGASRSFMTECEALKTLRHRNLVKVLTACSSVDYHGNDFKALVYEYMDNGSLKDWLHPTVGINEVDEAPRNLDFLQKLRIAIDIACALEYLHHHCETPVVHCDIKPSNVLLDNEMTAHVGDFGLAKFLSQNGEDAATHESSSIGVRGTTGYAPPEYGMGSEVSVYGDVSYGILLLEMFTGKRPTDDMFREGLNLHNFAKATLPERAAEITDPVLLGEMEEGETSTNISRNQSHSSHIIQECLNLIIEIGVACSQDFPGERMSINDVAPKLHFLSKKLLKTRIHREVTKLVLKSSQLSGSISPHIGNLSFIRLLNLNNNSFSDEIPSEIGHLRRLKLHLANNSFSGEIPGNISSCTNLVDIIIYNNHIVGEISESLGSLFKLRYIVLGHNNLTGSIPSSFGNLSSLEQLYVSFNNLDGILPDSLGELKNLLQIAIAFNRLNGIIPPSIFNISSMTVMLEYFLYQVYNFISQVIDVAFNLFHGNLPSHLSVSLPNLLYFPIVQNQFTGSIQFSFSNASQLETLELDSNQLMVRGPFMSKLPRLQWLSVFDNYLGSGGGDDLSFLSSLVNATRATTFQYLAISYNNFGGMLPQEICNLTELIHLLLNDNQIHGSVPPGIVNLVNLQRIDASDNHLSGIILPNIGILQNVVILYLDNNMLTGHIPSSFVNSTNLDILGLSQNNLHGSIPSNLSKSLSMFNLSSNKLSGIIPQTIGLSSLLIGVDLSRNHLISSIPTEVEKLTHLEELYLSENMLSGEIPSSLSSCTSLEDLHMEGNFLHGPIPS
ncbi:LOW QUALITY PROTEIN: Pkinase domain-containing protein/LRR_1 domain-containing protein/LRRNT_2 domain-containing protein/LRR_4 domain-containing protein/LRR_6 domain-containing protein/LRR_8 domain-containing protein, partial [Cephalotus follicularis]